MENIADEGRLRFQYSQPREFIKFSNMFLLFFNSILTPVIKLTNNPISIFTNSNADFSSRWGLETEAMIEIHR